MRHRNKSSSTGYFQKIRSSPLTRELLLKILLISLILILSSAFIQIMIAYHSGKKSIDELMDHIEEIELHAISTSVYNINQELLQIELDSLIKHDAIVYAEVQEIRGRETIFFSSGDKGFNGHIIKRFPISYKLNTGQEQPLGTLLVAASLDSLYSALIKQALFILLENLIIITVISVLIFFLTESTITRHISMVARYTNELDLDRLERPLQLDRRKKPGSEKDEFDVLVESVNHMRIRIGEEILNRKKSLREKKKMEEQYHQSQKMDSIGRLAGGVAHDLNNLLTPIIVYSELLEDQFEQGTPNRNYSEGIQEAGEKARNLIDQLLSFSRKSPRKLVRIDLNKTIEDFVKLLRRTIRENIQLNLMLSEEPQMISGDRGKIEQILMNLSVNAQGAMKRNGILSIETKSLMLDESYTRTHPEVTPGKYVMLAISDTGSGISKKVMPHIYEPFFTTKGELGTGLGLATVYGIVRQHNGSIWVNSEKNKGTSFKIYLPVHDNKDDQTELPVKAPSLPDKGTETILLVEDNKQVRELTKMILEDQEYTVYTAGSSKDALEILTNDRFPIHLLLTDVILPGLNGKELFERARVNHEHLKVLYMSGYTDNILPFQHDGLINFIQKPFTRAALIRKIREILI